MSSACGNELDAEVRMLGDGATHGRELTYLEYSERGLLLLYQCPLLTTL